MVLTNYNIHVPWCKTNKLGYVIIFWLPTSIQPNNIKGEHSLGLWRIERFPTSTWFLNVFIKQLNTLFNHSLSFNETLSNNHRKVIHLEGEWNKKKGWKHGKACQSMPKKYPPCSHIHNYDINMKKIFKLKKTFIMKQQCTPLSLWLATHKVWKNLVQENGWKVFSKLAKFSNFETYFYVKTLVDYDYNMRKFKMHWCILMFHPFERGKAGTK
jgi:hypothetical protein